MSEVSAQEVNSFPSSQITTTINNPQAINYLSSKIPDLPTVVDEPPIRKVTMSPFARTIMVDKYAHDLREGRKEEWHEIAQRVGKTILKSINASKSLIDQ